MHIAARTERDLEVVIAKVLSSVRYRALAFDRLEGPIAVKSLIESGDDTHET